MFVCSLRRARTLKVIGGSRTRSLVDHGHAPIRIGLDHQEVELPRCLIFMSLSSWLACCCVGSRSIKNGACKLNERK